MTMRYLSLFDGIGAACVAWEPLGWECVGVSEIEPLPIAVTKHHRPHAPHLGDVTKITEEQIAALGRIDLIVGGFPCQDVSVAGKRAGLRNEDGSATRSGLFFDAMRVVRVARERCGLRWLLIENVPGLYSNRGGRDFAAVVGAMVGTEFDVPRDGWRNAGFAAGPDGLCEWATLDAQFFGVAQRRRRVFALADFGDWANRPPILLEPDSLRGDSPPSREAGKGTPAGALRSTDGGSDVDHARAGQLIPAPHDVISPALKARDSKGPSSDGDGDGAILVPMVAPTLRAGGNRTGGDRPPGTDVDTCESLVVTHSLRTEGFDASEDGTGRGTPIVPVAFDTTQITSEANRSNPQPGDPCHTLAKGGHAPAIAFAHQAGGTQTTLGYDPKLGTAPTLSANQTPAVITYGEIKHAGAQETDATSALRALRKAVGAQAFAEWGLGILDSLHSSEVLRQAMHGVGVRLPAFSRSWVVCCALGSPFSCSEGAVQSLREAGCAGCSPQGWEPPEQLARELGTYLSGLSHPGAQAERLMRDLWRADEGTGVLREALSAIQEARRSAHGQGEPARAGLSVRRLTTTECTFLQGFPRNYLDITYRGKPAADGPKYRALGNSFAVPVVAWIGRRIAEVTTQQAAA